MKTPRHCLFSNYGVAACVLLASAILHAEIAYFHDLSGNLTTGAVQSISLPATFLVASNRTLTVSNALSLSVGNQGAGACTYQWRLNGTDITDATNAHTYQE